MRVTLLPALEVVMTALHVSPSISQHLVGGPTSIEVTARRPSIVGSLTVILGVTKA